MRRPFSRFALALLCGVALATAHGEGPATCFPETHSQPVGVAAIVYGVHALPDAGHLLHVESAAVVAPLYIDFLRSR